VSVSNNWQLAMGIDTPTTVNGAAGTIHLANPTYLDIGGGTVGQVLTVADTSGNTVWATPTATGADAPADGAVYGRINGAWGQALPLSGGAMQGTLFLNSDPGAPLAAATKQYVDNSPNRTITISGDVTGSGNATILTALSNVGSVTPGHYTYADITVDSKGRVILAANGVPPAGSVLVDGLSITGTGTTVALTVAAIDCGTY
jgi:hypothetical protein